MNRFAALLERLVLTPQRNVKLRLMRDYFGATPDPDRGYALAALTADLSIASVKPAMLRALITERLDPILFGYSYDYVGDLAETIALAWPARADHPPLDGEGQAEGRGGVTPSRHSAPPPDRLRRSTAPVQGAVRMPHPSPPSSRRCSLLRAWKDRG